MLEHVCHLRDIEVEGYAPRLKRILSEDGPFLPDIDGRRLASSGITMGRILDRLCKPFRKRGP